MTMSSTSAALQNPGIEKTMDCGALRDRSLALLPELSWRRSREKIVAANHTTAFQNPGAITKMRILRLHLRTTAQ